MSNQAKHEERILVVEDDHATLEYLVCMLNVSGYQIHGVSNGQAARDYLMEHAVDAILLDRRLPDADGLALCRELRERMQSDLPIIIMSADDRAGLARLAREAGATDLLHKPFVPRKLEDMLAAAFAH